MNHLACLNVIRRAHDGHAGDGAHESEILAALMRRAVLADRDTAVRGANFYVQMRIADRIAYLLVGAPRREHRERRDKGDESHRREPRAHVDHVALGDAAVEMPLGERFLERPALRRPREIGVEHDNILMMLSEFYECIAVAVTRCDFLYVRHRHASSSIRL